MNIVEFQDISLSLVEDMERLAESIAVLAVVESLDTGPTGEVDSDSVALLLDTKAAWDRFQDVGAARS